MTLLAVSPHLDDAVFSAGGALATAVAAGHRVVVATVFTRSMPDPAGFALACQTDKGIGPEVDYLAARRGEDADACERIGAEAVWLNLPEAPHRGYDSAAALFGGILEGDRDTWRGVRARVAAVVSDCLPDLVLTCQGLGGHVDHLHTVRAVASLADIVPRERADVQAVSWWYDVPYALRQHEHATAVGVPDGARSVGLPLTTDALTVKLDACVAYASQIGYQFGRDADGPPADALRQRLAAFADDEGRRLEVDGPAEGFLTASHEAWDRLWAVAPSASER